MKPLAGGRVWVKCHRPAGVWGFLSDGKRLVPMEGHLRLLSKSRDEVTVAFDSGLELTPGDCVTVTDASVRLLAQVCDVRYGAFRKAVGEVVSGLLSEGEDEVKELIRRHDHVFRDTWVAKCKIRGHICQGRFQAGLMRFPSENPRVEKLCAGELVATLGLEPKMPALMGTFLGDSKPLFLDLAGLQGVSLITGRKGSGKSHLAKKFLEQMVNQKAPAVVLDVNGEYAQLGIPDSGATGGRPTMVELVPGKNFFIPLDGIPFETFARMCQIEENHNAFRLFARYWSEHPQGKSLEKLREWIPGTQSPPGTVHAAFGRIQYAASLRVFGPFDFTGHMARIRSGGALVLNLFQQGEKVKQLSIVYVLRQLIEAGLRNEGKLFLFAEEAQNYFEKEFWDDVITRMRHLGVYSVIVTNEPTTLPGMVFRQCDNLFCFNFSSDNDLAFVSNAQVIDPESLEMAKLLSAGQCIAIGACTRGFPLLLHVGATRADAAGRTRLLWE